MSMRYWVAQAAALGGRWPRFMYERAREDGLAGVEDGLQTTVNYSATGLSRMVAREVYNPGTPVWEGDWDVLLVLDACRVDLMREVVDEYDFLPDADDLDSRWSVASMSSDWLRRTFASEHAADVSETAYVTGNAFTKDDVFAVEPAHLDEVWTYAWDEDVNTIRPRALTDRAIDTWRDRPAGVERMIVHYMQPHVPFVANPDLGEYTRPEDFGRGFADIWGRVGEDLSREEVWAAYRQNLRDVLDDVELLLENLDADRVAITADHGNSLGTLGFSGHPSDILLPTIRRVPWVLTTATDEGTYEPELQPPDRSPEVDVEDRLADLGYR